MARIILHIGAGKCGSSALQRFLCENPILPLKSGGRLIYSVVLSDGTVLDGADLKSRASKSLAGYVTSTFLSSLVSLGKGVHFDVTAQDIVVLSNEGWRKEWNRLKVQDALSVFNEIEAVMYIRPQTTYMNSAYWQWGAWEEMPFERWFEATLAGALWLTSITGWIENSRVRKLTTRLLPEDIVSDFLRWTGVDLEMVSINQKTNVNKSLPDSVLRVLQRHRHLRPGPHESNIDFVLEKIFGGIGSGPAWILSEERVRQIVNYCRVNNEEVLKCLSEEQATLMRADRRWWEPVFPDREIESPLPQPAEDEETDNILALAFAQIYSCELQRLKGKH